MTRMWGDEPKPPRGPVPRARPARRGRIIGGGSRSGPDIANYDRPKRAPRKSEDAFCVVCGLPYATTAGHRCRPKETLGKPVQRIGRMTADVGAQPARPKKGATGTGTGRSGALPGRGRATSRVEKQRGVENTAKGQGRARWRPAPDKTLWKPFWGKPPKDPPAR